MDILQQCQKWHENDEHQKIIDTLEAIPQEAHTADIDMELARAYNNLGAPGEPEGRRMLKHAIQLMQAHEEELKETYSWNFRMGYAWYYLDQEGRAIPYLRKALELHSGDDPKLNSRQDIEEFLEDCTRRTSLPRFAECFRERTETAWEAFAEQEAALRRTMDEDKNHERGEELIGQCEAILNLAFDSVSFEMGYNGERYELVLTPEGDKVRLFELVYFQRHAPQEVLEHWNILMGRQPVENIGLRSDRWEVSGDDVQIWVEELDKNSFGLSAYCEKLLPLLQEEEGRAWWMLTTLTDQVLGEIPHMRYIDSFDVLEAPKEASPILLSALPDKLKDMGLDLSTDPDAYLESYTGYQMEPNEDPEADWRLDTIVGSTCCPPLMNSYLGNDNDYMDDLHADGAVAGFFCYPLDTLREEEGSQKIFDFRDKLEEALTAGDGPEALTLTGGATGLYCGYVDFIAWDLGTALNLAKKFFEDSDIPWANFHVFRREAGSVCLKKPEDDAPDTEELEDESAPTVLRTHEEGTKYSEGGSDDEEDDQADHKGTFAGFVLLSKGQWDKEQFIRDMKEKWDITVEEDDEDKRDDAVVFQVGDLIAAVSLMPYPIPDGEAELNAENNYMWPGAVKAAKEHSAHIMVAVLGKEETILERGKLYTKLVAACCRQKYASGVYTSGVVFEPRFYEGFADMMKSDALPIFNWIWFGLYQDEGGMSAYTYGMDVFGKDEMEVLNTNAQPGDLRDFLASLVSYVLENDVELHDGETIGFSEEDKHTITRSKGVALPEEQMTLKISWEPLDGGLDTQGEETTEQPEAYSVEDQVFDEDTLEPSQLAQAMMDYLDCECTYFPSMKDDDPIMSAYRCARRDGTHEGYVPVLVKVDETLWECLVMNSDPDSDGADDYTFDPAQVAEYRRNMLFAPVKEGKALLEELTGQRKAEAEDDDLDWEDDILGEMEGGYDNDRFSSYWNHDTGMTYPLILAKIPVQNPWDIFAHLPFGNWNECPDTPSLMAVAKYWFEQYGAIPGAMSHDELEFELPSPVSKENAMEAAAEQYGFCPDIVDQEPENATVGSLADVLWQSTVWYFWWD